MTWREDVDEVLAMVEFTYPVEVADCKTVQMSIKSALPEGARVEVYHRTTEVIVRVDFEGGRYDRRMKVTK